MSWNETEMDVIRWSEARGIIPNSTSIAQYRKAQEEMHELHTALIERDRRGTIDGVGDVLVCLINICALENITMTSCLKFAYEEIKDRKGHMNAGGIFIKESQSPAP